MKQIYLDNNSTTAVHPQVRDKMLPYLSEEFGNPSSTSNVLGINAKNAINHARQNLADLLDSQENEILFLSGGTESCFSALIGSYLARPEKNHFIISSVEHPAVIEAARFLELHFKCKISFIPVDKNGQYNLSQLETDISANTNLISTMLANNETGICSPLFEITELAHSHNILVHTDATQAVGKSIISFKNLNVDFFSLSGHKFHAPKGIGALLIKNNSPWTPFIKGGGQEDGRRGGTEAVANIVALGEAAKQAKITITAEKISEIEKSRNYFETKLVEIFPDAIIHGKLANRICNTSNFSLQDTVASEILDPLANNGLIIASGSACKSAVLKPSAVLTAMGYSLNEAISTFRISLGSDTSLADIDHALNILQRVVLNYRKQTKAILENSLQINS